MMERRYSSTLPLQIWYEPNLQIPESQIGQHLHIMSAPRCVLTMREKEKKESLPKQGSLSPTTLLSVTLTWYRTRSKSPQDPKMGLFACLCWIAETWSKTHKVSGMELLSMRITIICYWCYPTACSLHLSTPNSHILVHDYTKKANSHLKDAICT